MNHLTRLATAVSVVALTAGAVFGGESATSRPVKVDLTFATHLDADMAEQDVFVEHTPGSGEVFRPTKAGRDGAAAVYAAATPTAHEPFDPGAIGPYRKGKPLGFSLADWLGARGAGTYSCVDGVGTIDVAFDGLVPNGVYTMWHFFMAAPPTIGTYDLPFGNRDGNDSVFAADAKGHARFQKTAAPCLQLSGEQLMAGLAIAWHSDGKTYGVEAGDFGKVSHVQLFLGLPKHSDL